MEITDFIYRLLMAMLVGGLVGLEREWSNKSAGLKTNMLVAIGACIYVLINIRVSGDSEGSDPTRIIGQIVTGIGFLGGGVILRTGLNIQGLTTAATIWCSAALGCLAGLGMFVEALISAAAVLSVNLVFRKAEGWFDFKSKSKQKSE